MKGYRGKQWTVLFVKEGLVHMKSKCKDRLVCSLKVSYWNRILNPFDQKLTLVVIPYHSYILWLTLLIVFHRQLRNRKLDCFPVTFSNLFRSGNKNILILRQNFKGLSKVLLVKFKDIFLFHYGFNWTLDLDAILSTFPWCQKPSKAHQTQWIWWWCQD